MANKNSEPEEDGVQDGRTALTKTSGMMDDVPTDPEKGDFEIGLKANEEEGYIRLPMHSNGQIEEFTLSKEEVDQYVETREEISPMPSPPESVTRESNIEAPSNWDGGEAVHTGGNIWCRSWRKHLKDNVYIAVRYQLAKSDGISVSLETENREWIGEVHLSVYDEFKHDEDLQPKAKEIMQLVDSGEIDESIQEKLEDTNVVDLS